nr:hypothetical protein [Granulicella tundricola]
MRGWLTATVYGPPALATRGATVAGAMVAVVEAALLRVPLKTVMVTEKTPPAG